MTQNTLQSTSPKFEYQQLAQSFINGDLIKGQDTWKVTNPTNQQLVATISGLNINHELDYQQLERAIQSNHRVQQQWKELMAKERCGLLQKWYDLIMMNKPFLAQLIHEETGKLIVEAQAEVEYAAAFILWYAQQGRNLNGEVIATQNPHRRQWVYRKPLGVVAAITPWNFPLAMVARKAGAALAAGCTLTLKPSDMTPLSATVLAHLAIEAGIPAGAFNVILISKEQASETGKFLCKHSLIRKLSFTGSTAVGKLLMKQSSSNLQRLALELGGNAPFIVYDDADLSSSLKGALQAKLRNSGQTCVAANRFLLQKNIAQTFVIQLVDELQKISITPIAPLIHIDAVQKVKEHVADALAKGATILYQSPFDEQNPCAFPITVLTNCNKHMKVWQEETFGPIFSCFTFDTIEQSIIDANDTPYGLAAYAFTENHRTILRLHEQLDFGMVGMNIGQVSNENTPFGGIKQSGFGKEGGYQGLVEYTYEQLVCIGQ